MIKKTIEFYDLMEGEIKYLHEKHLDNELIDSMKDAAHATYIKAKAKEYREEIEKLNSRKRVLSSELKELRSMTNRCEMEQWYLDDVYEEPDSLDGLIKD